MGEPFVISSSSGEKITTLFNPNNSFLFLIDFLFIVIFFKPVVSCDKVTVFLELSLFLKKPLIKKRIKKTPLRF